ncbi:MAG: hypothetical protein ABR949_11815 [Candidatus Aquilonibacter sp.]|jgi:hypothetical protein
MTQKFAVALVCTLALSAAAARAADVPSDVYKTITGDYQLSCAAVLDPTDAKLTAAFGYLSPDYVDTDIKGKTLTRDQVVAISTQFLKQLHSTVCEPSVLTQTLNNDGSVTVVTQLHLAGSIESPNGKHDVDATQKAQDTWKQIAGTWMVVQGLELHNTVKMDGNTIQDEGQ